MRHIAKDVLPSFLSSIASFLSVICFRIISILNGDVCIYVNLQHHCRRCGGLFCGSCTQQRMYLRGQGDSPVRICEPCKTLEEAARFEMRYGHKNKSRKGASKLASDNEDDLLGNESISSEKGSVHLRPSASSSNTDMEVDFESTTPEELRQKAVEEKKKHKTLKAEGKPEEALRAFKRGKELERQAGALEIELRKNRKKALSSTSVNENSKAGIEKQPKQKDDLVNELRELGWSDHDLHDADKKPVNMTLEGELSTLLKQVSQKNPKTEKGNVGIDKSEVIAIKKKALAFKREGKLTEAKEELKKAKILEKQIEERELLGDDSDSESDDEFKSLMRSMDIDKQDILASGNDRNRNHNIDVDFNFDFDHQPDFDVTEEDMDDPEMSAALQSLGWTEDHSVNDDVAVLTEKIQSLKREALIKKRAGQTNEALALLKKAKMLEKGENNDPGASLELDSGPKPGPKTGPKSKLAIQRELLALKKKALALRREGKADEADQELAKGKALEEQLEELESGPKVKPPVKPIDFSTPMEVEDEDEDVTDMDMNDPSYLSLLQNLGWQEEEKEVPKVKAVDFSTPKPKSKTEIQRELLALKRKSLALRREGKVDEAEEVLQKTKGLEAQLAELEGPNQNLDQNIVEKTEPQTDEVWVEEKAPALVTKSTESTESAELGSVQERVMAHKRKALSLKREGRLAEAKEELKLAKLLENKNRDMNTDTDMVDRTPGPSPVPVPVTSEPSGSIAMEPEGTSESSPPPSVKLSSRERFKLQQESLGHKRKALKLRREGKNEEAEAEFELAKNLESQLEAASEAVKPPPGDDVGVEDLLDPQLLFALREVGIEGGGGARPSPEKVAVKKVEVEAVAVAVVNKSERVELEEEIKAAKVNAVKLKRAGKQGEALDALRRAKLLEKKLNSLS
ncbi:hypothetical protein Lser_V15G32144 [Lactuca serriola]